MRAFKRVVKLVPNFPNYPSILSRNMTSFSAIAKKNIFQIGLCQIAVGKDKSDNLAHASVAISKAVVKGADLIVLPEIFNSPYSNASFPVYCEPVPNCNTLASQIEAIKVESPSVHMLSSAAKQHQKYIIGGSIAEKRDDKLFNTCLVFNPNGDIIAKYSKMHLFDINIPGKITFYESETLTAGTDFVTFDIHDFEDVDAFKIGIGICYDLRFSEVCEIYRQMGCSMVVFPGAFNTTTGPLHWQLLQRSRATDNQMYIVSCSPANNPQLAEYPVHGYSMIADPWAKVIAECGKYEQILVAAIDLSIVKEIRESIPIWKQKRSDMYSAISLKTINSKL